MTEAGRKKASSVSEKIRQTMGGIEGKLTDPSLKSLLTVEPDREFPSRVIRLLLTTIRLHLVQVQQPGVFSANVDGRLPAAQACGPVDVGIDEFSV